MPRGCARRRRGKFGPFAGCSRYPDCTYIHREAPPIGDAPGSGETCPECQTGTLVTRRGRFGPFVGCNRYPECRYIHKPGGAKGGAAKDGAAASPRTVRRKSRRRASPRA